MYHEVLYVILLTSFSDVDITSHICLASIV